MTPQPASPLPKPPTRPPVTMPQALGFVGLLAILLIIIDINQRLGMAQRLRASADNAGTQVALLQAENAALRTQVAYATTDASVSDWAHSNGKLVLPSEVLVIPVVPTAQPTQVPPPPATPPPPPNWELWWNLFFAPGPLVLE